MIKSLIEKRAGLATQANEILTKAKDGVLNAEEETKFNALHGEIDGLTKQIEHRQRQEDIEKYLAKPQERKVTPEAARIVTPETRVAADRELLLRGWFLAGSDQPVPVEHREAAGRLGFRLDSKYLTFRLSPKAPKTFADVATLETRQQSTASDGSGGETVPDDVMRSLEDALLHFGGMRQVAQVIRTARGSSLPIPTSNDTAEAGEIIAENVTVGAHAGITFGQLVLGAFKYSSKPVMVSMELMQDSAINLAAFIGSKLGERIGRIQNAHYTTGAGTTLPFGLVVRSAEGVAPAGSVGSGITYDHLIDLEHSVDVAYRSGASFMLNDLTVAKLKKIRDDVGRPLWQAGLANGAPNTIMGYPYVVNNDMASAQTNGTKVLLFGALNKYLIRDVLDVTLLRLDERFAELGQVAFLAFARSDGDLLDAGTDPVKHFAYTT